MLRLHSFVLCVIDVALLRLVSCYLVSLTKTTQKYHVEDHMFSNDFLSRKSKHFEGWPCIALFTRFGRFFDAKIKEINDF